MQLQSRTDVRRRGVTLTNFGLRKLNRVKAEVEIEQNFKRYTLEALSEKTGLTPNTLSKVFTGSARVDKRTLECLFDALNLTLSTDDYFYLKPIQDNLAEIGSLSPVETCCFTESGCDSRDNTPQIHKMDSPPDNLQPRPPTIPGGQMPPDLVSYIDRPILQSLCYEAIQRPGAMLYIRAPKQMGKTSLMTRILACSRSLGYQTVSVSLQLADTEILQNLERFLQWFCARVSQELDLPQSRRSAKRIADFVVNNHLGSKANATDYFEDVLFANLDRPLVIALDELSRLFTYPNIASEFLQLLRTWSEKAKEGDADSNSWHKLRLVTVHSTEILISRFI